MYLGGKVELGVRDKVYDFTGDPFVLLDGGVSIQPIESEYDYSVYDNTLLGTIDRNRQIDVIIGVKTFSDLVNDLFSDFIYINKVIHINEHNAYLYVNLGQNNLSGDEIRGYFRIISAKLEDVSNISSIESRFNDKVGTILKLSFVVEPYIYDDKPHQQVALSFAYYDELTGTPSRYDTFHTLTADKNLTLYVSKSTLRDLKCTAPSPIDIRITNLTTGTERIGHIFVGARYITKDYDFVNGGYYDDVPYFQESYYTHNETLHEICIGNNAVIFERIDGLNLDTGYYEITANASLTPIDFLNFSVNDYSTYYFMPGNLFIPKPLVEYATMLDEDKYDVKFVVPNSNPQDYRISFIPLDSYMFCYYTGYGIAPNQYVTIDSLRGYPIVSYGGMIYNSNGRGIFGQQDSNMNIVMRLFGTTFNSLYFNSDIMINMYIHPRRYFFTEITPLSF